jgi:uncharacterized damage-inducible protein DinB
MAIAEALAAELTREAVPTRRILERIPESQFAWKPHAKSMGLGQLAFHIAILPRAIADLVTSDTEAPTFKPREDATLAEILSALDESVPYAIERLTAWGDEGLFAKWRMTSGGQTLLEMPRIGMVRGVMLNHWYHHRGQLTVYLRLLDVPLPSIYGPSADENPFG